jgi:hypothetical protein
MSLDLRRSRISPWAGWLLGPLAWAFHHQAGSDLAFGMVRCSAGGAPQTGLGVVCAVIAALGVWMSWTSKSGALRSSEFNVRMFVALVGAMGSATFLLAILFQICASLIVPPCHSG